MSRLLYIQASPRGRRSKSVAVADAFLEAYKGKYPDDEIVTLNVFDDSIPDFNGLVVQAKYAILHGQAHSAEQLRAWGTVEKVVEQFKSADKYVVAVPMWEFCIPYRLKQYIDVIVQPGYLFSYSQTEGYKGLVVGKSMLVVYARGGEYKAGSQAEAFDLQTRYIELIFRFAGFEDIKSLVVEPTLAAGPDAAKAAQQRAIEWAKEMAGSF